MRRSLHATAAIVFVVTLAVAWSTAASAPLNDDFTDAETVDVSTLPVTIQGSTEEATTEGAEPDPCSWNRELRHTVWYKFTPSERRRLQVTVETGPQRSEKFFPVVAVYTTDDPQDPDVWDTDRVACWDSKNADRTAVKTWVDPGETYWVQVGGSWQSGRAKGPFNLTIESVEKTHVEEYVATKDGYVHWSGLPFTDRDYNHVGPVWVAGSQTVDVTIRDRHNPGGPFLVRYTFLRMEHSFGPVETKEMLLCGGTDLDVPNDGELLLVELDEGEHAADGIAWGEAPPDCARNPSTATYGEVEFSFPT